MKNGFLLVMVLFSVAVYSQTEHLSSFNNLSVTYKFHPKFFLVAEGQLRGIEDFSYPDYYEIKGGLGYNIAKNHKPFIGIGRYGNYRDHLLNKEEFRIWLQDVYDLQFEKFKFENRFRAEKSWFYEPMKDAHSDRIRLRYRLNVSLPLNSNTVKPGTVSANIYDEVFFVVTEKPNFARNRVYSGLSYQIDEYFSVSSGYLWQREFSKSGNRNLHFLYLALSVVIDDAQRKSREISQED